MLQISINIELFDKQHIKLLLEIIKKQSISNAVFITEHQDRFQIMFENDYEQYELQQKIGNCFEGFSYTTNIDNNIEEVKLAIHITQSAMSTDNWGRQWNENDVNTSKYLVKRKIAIPDIPNPKFWVLFGQELRTFAVDIRPCVNKLNNQIGYIVVNDKTNKKEEAELLVDKLFQNVSSAFWEGFRLLGPEIEEEYLAYTKELKKKARKNSSKKNKSS
jgi:hypothetical protein